MVRISGDPELRHSAGPSQSVSPPRHVDRAQRRGYERPTWSPAWPTVPPPNGHYMARGPEMIEDHQRDAPDHACWVGWEAATIRAYVAAPGVGAESGVPSTAVFDSGNYVPLAACTWSGSAWPGSPCGSRTGCTSPSPSSGSSRTDDSHDPRRRSRRAPCAPTGSLSPQLNRVRCS